LMSQAMAGGLGSRQRSSNSPTCRSPEPSGSLNLTYRRGSTTSPPGPGIWPAKPSRCCPTTCGNTKAISTPAGTGCGYVSPD
jgi:hypothetical protein